MNKEYASIHSTENDDDIDGDLKPAPRKRYIRPKGWRFGILNCAVAASFAFLVNFIITIATLGKAGVGKDGRQILYSGDCDTVEKMNTGIHLFINVMSTILLSSSNYCMQCLSAATREEIDAAHKMGRSVDVGAHSMRNLRRIQKGRVALWLVLAMSSVPLHLFYNSAVFSSIATYAYPMIAVNEGFTTAPGNMTNITDYSYSGSEAFKNNTNCDVGNGYCSPLIDPYGAEYILSAPWRLKQQAMNGELDTLTREECMNAYGTNFVSDRGGVILVLEPPTDNANASTPALFMQADSEMAITFCSWDRYAWLCMQDGDDSCEYEPSGSQNNPPCSARIDTIKANASGWLPLNVQYPVTSCLSKRLPQQCKLQASLHIMLIVLLLNAVKAAVMVRVVYWLKNRPVLTIGDAIASFLERPDPGTQGVCLSSKNDVLRQKLDGRSYTIGRPQPFIDVRPRWRDNVGRSKSVSFWTLFTLSLIVISVLLSMAINAIKSTGTTTSLTSLWSLGFGSANPATIITWTLPQAGATGLIANAFAANSPQIVLSTLYFLFNSIFTAMFLGAEWQGFMDVRKGLRVSDRRRGAQRATYFLQLPYRAGVPLMMASGLLHWLVGQSIFLVDIEGFVWEDSTGNYVPASVGDNISQLTCGFSPMPMILVLILGVGMVVPLFMFGMKRFKTNMPVVGCNSFAIAAACHVEKDEAGEDGAAIQRVQWGVVSHSEDGVGHCAFSSKEVMRPMAGSFYA